MKRPTVANVLNRWLILSLVIVSGIQATYSQSTKEDHAVKITSLPPKDTFDIVALFVNGGLLLVGLAGVGIGLFTLRNVRETSQRQLRAYLTVQVGPAIYQERRSLEDGGDLMFECHPILANTGQTPANKIRFKARAAVLPSPLPSQIHLAEGFDSDTGESILGPRQDGQMTAVVDGFQLDDKVHDIKYGLGEKALYVWGLITYEDVFGGPHFTRFCQRIYWDLKDNVRGHYIPGRNDAD